MAPKDAPQRAKAHAPRTQALAPAQMRDVAAALASAFPKAPADAVTPDALAALATSLAKANEAALGRHAPADAPFAKLPAHCFDDARVDGPLQGMLHAWLAQREKTEWKEASPPHSMPAAELYPWLSACREHLIDAGHVVAPAVLLQADAEASDALAAGVKRLGGVIVTSSAAATHVVVAGAPAPAAEKQPMRVLAVNRAANTARVHLARHPDGFDRDVPLGDLPGDAKAEPWPSVAPMAPVRVSLAWLEDSIAFREFCNDNEYIYTGTATDASPASKRARVGDVSAHAAADAAAPVAGDDTANLKATDVETKKEGTEELEGGEKKEEEEEEEEKDDGPSEPLRELYRIPGHAAWFRWEQVHNVEKRALPEFFDGQVHSKTPALYKEYRDHIMDAFRENPRRRLTFTEVRKTMAGDVNSMHRIFLFLESWGLINYVPASGATAAGGGKASRTLAADGPPAALSVVAAPASSLFAFDAVRPGLVPGAGRAGAAGAQVPAQGYADLVTRRADATAARIVAAVAAQGAEFFCDMCGADATMCRWHSRKHANYDLCAVCWSKGSLPEGTCGDDFVRIDAVAEDGAAAVAEATEDGGDGAGASTTAPPPPWTEQETLLLLEGLEIHGESWQKVAEHVGTRSQHECLLHFLRMPIEDAMLDEMELGGDPCEATEVAEDGSVVERHPIPFGDAGNPVMAQVAFLAATVGPRVAAAAAQGALTALVEAGEPGAGDLAGELADGGAGADMDVDGAAPSSAKVKVAAGTALAAAAVKAKLLADSEEREVQRLVVNAIEAKWRQVEKKLTAFEALEAGLAAERESLEQQRMTLYGERVSLRASILAARKRAAAAEAKAAAAAAAEADAAKAAASAEPAAEAPEEVPAEAAAGAPAEAAAGAPTEPTADVPMDEATETPATEQPATG